MSLVARMAGPAVALAAFSLVMAARGALARGHFGSSPPASLRAALSAQARLEGGAASLDDLGQKVAAALARGDRDALASLCVTRSEFRTAIFPRMSADQAAGADFYFDNMAAGSTRDLHRALSELRGKRVEFALIASPPDHAERRGELTIHRDIELRVRVDGQLRALSLLGGVAEVGGVFKVTRYRRA
jgi:hypothetical protein